MNEEKQESTVQPEQLLCSNRVTCRNHEAAAGDQQNIQCEDKNEDVEQTHAELPSVKQESAEGTTKEPETVSKTESKEMTTENSTPASQDVDQPILGEEDIKTIDPLSRCTLFCSHLIIKTIGRSLILFCRVTTSTMVITAFSPVSYPLLFLCNAQWGMSSSGVIRGMTSDFRYVLKLSAPSTPNEPVNGSYNGYFWMRSVPISRVTENNLILSFTKYHDHYIVDGTGQNRMGPFSIAGLYFPSTHIMNCEKLSRFLEF